MPQESLQQKIACDPPPPKTARTTSRTSTCSGSTLNQTPTSPMSPGFSVDTTTARTVSYLPRHHPSSPTSPPTSPVEQGFFGALTQKIRSRSRSRSRGDLPRNRSKSPMSPSHRSPVNSVPSSPRQVQPPQFSPVSRDSSQSIPKMKRRSTDCSHGSHGSNPWYGRHSNSWLFNDFSVTEHVSGALHKLRRS
jgi:hypothetical protein